MKRMEKKEHTFFTERKFLIAGFVFTSVVGTLLHFVYEWSGRNAVIGLFVPVSESTWEHLKMLFFPAVIWAVSGALAYRKKGEGKRLFAACAEGICAGLFVIVGFFYTYTGILGFHLLAMDILAFLLGVLAVYVTAGKKWKRSGDIGKGQFTFWIVVLALLMGCFFYFTYHVPPIGLFEV